MLKLPTDNLYKFIAIFGLVFVVFSSYMLNQTADKTEITISFILLDVGIVTTVFGFITWYIKTQRYNDRILKNESEKLLNDKTVLIHKIQFEKEFNIYDELWPCLTDLRNATHALRPNIEQIDMSIPEEVRRKKKAEDFIKAHNKCVGVFDNNKPFYPEDIYEKIADLILKTKFEKNSFDFMLEVNLERFDEAKLKMDEIIQKVESICLKIRSRIGTLKTSD